MSGLGSRTSRRRRLLSIGWRRRSWDVALLSLEARTRCQEDQPHASRTSRIRTRFRSLLGVLAVLGVLGVLWLGWYGYQVWHRPVRFETVPLRTLTAPRLLYDQESQQSPPPVVEDSPKQVLIK